MISIPNFLFTTISVHDLTDTHTLQLLVVLPAWGLGSYELNGWFEDRERLEERGTERAEAGRRGQFKRGSCHTVDPVHRRLEMVSCPEQGVDNGCRHRRGRRLGLEAPVDDMGGAGELQRQQQHRPRREDPLRSPHHVLRLQEEEDGQETGMVLVLDGW